MQAPKQHSLKPWNPHAGFLPELDEHLFQIYQQKGMAENQVNEIVATRKTAAAIVRMLNS